MKRLLLIFLFLSFFSPMTCAASDGTTITLPKFRCQVEATLYVVYEPTAGPNRAYISIAPVLAAWGSLDQLVGESARITDNRELEDGSKRVTRATTIRTRGGIKLDLSSEFLRKIIRYTVEDPTTEIIFIYWDSETDGYVRKIGAVRCAR